MTEVPPKPTSAREALRRLSNKHPAPPDVDKILYDLMFAPDMTVAILSASLVESSLEKLIESRFEKTDTNLIGRIFYNRGPLSDFNSKILIADAFGIIPSQFSAELHSLQAIRNTFAHAKIQISFDNELIDREIKTLKFRSILPEALKVEVDCLDNRGWYAFTSRFSIIMMDGLSGRDSPH